MLQSRSQAPSDLEAPRRGRPSLYSPELAEKICDQIASGMSLEAVCRLAGMPSKHAVYDWLRAKPEFADDYARAREWRAYMMAEEILAIADRATPETVLQASLQIETRKWVYARMAPKPHGKYRATLEASQPKVEVVVISPEGQRSQMPW